MIVFFLCVRYSCYLDLDVAFFRAIFKRIEIFKPVNQVLVGFPEPQYCPSQRNSGMKKCLVFTLIQKGNHLLLFGLAKGTVLYLHVLFLLELGNFF